ncbi:CoA transferase [Ramlibacter sp. CrO1]|uniref:CoA transferase n=2 Tax=Ramlibacter algicola TaxID=2795217 RepID=A0A934URC9_9BURK|nr:CoA transferase [Ramlibacter algicola]
MKRDGSAGPAPTPLAGIRVLELGTMIAGPVVATLLGDFGADVIKIEQPDGGDPIRNIGPFCEGESLWWNVEGRNKKSVTLDLRQEEGQQMLRQLVRHADVLVENFRPGTMARWNVGYEQLSQENPRLVMVSVSGYGQTGPYAEKPAFDRIALAFAGLLNITGYADRAPVRPGVAMADYQSALFGAFAAMLALFHRDARGGTGQHVDVSLFESVFRFTDIMVTAADKVGVKRARRGNLHFAAAPGDHFETCDGRYIVMTISNNPLFAKLCEAMGQPALAKDERFATHDARWKNIEVVNGMVGDWIKSMPVSDILGILEQHGLPHSLVFSVDDILADPHYGQRGSIATLEHPALGPLKMPAPTPRLGGTPARAMEPAPALGRDNEAVYRGLLGLDEQAYASLKARGAI